MLTYKNIGQIYSKYANQSSPGSYVHGKASLERCIASAKINKALADGQPGWFPSGCKNARAKEYGAKAAMVPIAAFKVIDALLGTGLNSAGPVDVRDMKSASAHLGDLICSPTDTGLLGLTTGLPILVFMAAGSAIGSVLGAAAVCIGATYNALGGRGFQVTSPGDWLNQSAATGAAVSLLLGLSTVIGADAVAAQVALQGTLRLASGLAKAALAGAFYGAGYAAGWAAGQL